MPSTVVHVGLAGLLGVAILGDRFDARAILAVAAATAVIDLDTLIGMYWTGTHRAALHNVFVVLVPAAFLHWDERYREESVVQKHLGTRSPRLIWITLLCVFVGHILLDAFYNGVNLFWPIHDQFYDLSGRLYLSNREGLVQTFVEFTTTADGSQTVSESTSVGTTENTHYQTGFDPTPNADENVERIFPIAYTGELFVVALAGYLGVGIRLWEEYRGSAFLATDETDR